MNEFLNADCMAHLPDFADDYFDLAIADPPYGTGDFVCTSSGGNKPGKFDKVHKDVKWNDAIPSELYFNELKRVSKKRIIWGANYYNCFDPGGALIWYKNMGFEKFSQCEIASLSFQKKVDYFSYKKLSGFVNQENYIHPTQKPVQLYRWLLKNYAKPGDLILDTHVGSGSSLVACEIEGFDYVGYEIDKEYYDGAMKRIVAERSKIRLL
jgi:site-specific DNA-methyltransferase (adenine-specific)